MLKHEKLPSTNSGTHYNFTKIQENNQTPDLSTLSTLLIELIRQDKYKIKIKLKLKH